MTERDDEEYDIEETVLMVELQGIMENDFVGQVSQAKILGIDTEKPLLQLDDYTFCGQYSDTLGTNLIFEDTTDINGSDPLEKKLEYSCLTNKKLSLQRVFLKDNNDQTTQLNISGVISNEDQDGNDVSRSPKYTSDSEFITDAVIDRKLQKDTQLIPDVTSINVNTSKVDNEGGAEVGGACDVTSSKTVLPSTSKEKD